MSMDQFAGIPGTISPEAGRIRWIRHPDDPYTGARVYLADVSDGKLLATVGHEPAGKDGKLLWHIAVSHFGPDGTPDRVPSWDELKHAAYRLIPVDVPLVLVFPRRSAPVVDVAQTCLHLWESEMEIDA